MCRRRPLAFWAKWIAGIWLGAFLLIVMSILVRLHLQKFGGLASVQIRDAIIQIVQIYLPYFGIIFGAFFSNHKKNRWGNDAVDSMFPILVLFISALFNLLLITWTYVFLFDKYANIEDYLSDIIAIAAAMVFFICLFLSYLL